MTNPYREFAIMVTNSAPTLEGDMFAISKLARILEDTAEKFIARYEEALVLKRREPGKPPDAILRIDHWSWSCTTTFEGSDKEEEED